MRPLRLKDILLVAGAIIASSCSDNGVSAPEPVAVASITLDPPSASIVIGDSTRLAATVRDRAGNVLTGQAITWTSSDVSVATVVDGWVTARALGAPITITAASGGRVGTAVVSITQIPVAAVTVTPGSYTLMAGDRVTLVARTLDGAGRELSGRAVTWHSSDPNVATVSNGEVRGVSAGGPVTITASSENRSGSAVISVVAVPPGTLLTGIRDAVTFVDRCPTNDPAYETLRRDFELLSDGLPSTATITCTEPYSRIAAALLTDELIAMQTMRLVYYMSQGTAGKLPWTALGFYEWMTSEVAGVNIVTQQGNAACCQVINGKKYMIISRLSAANRDLYRSWNVLSGFAALFAHEARHVAGPGHVTGCPAFPLPTDPPGCDETYDLNNLGSYGIQYWLFSGWATGRINVGIGCAPPAAAQDMATWAASVANGYPQRFITNAPPMITVSAPYGGPCLRE